MFEYTSEFNPYILNDNNISSYLKYKIKNVVNNNNNNNNNNNVSKFNSKLEKKYKVQLIK